jgi:transposase
MAKSRGPYPLEYRQRIIELVRAGRSPGSLARESEPTEQCIRNWVRQADRDDGRRHDGLTSDERIVSAAESEHD